MILKTKTNIKRRERERRFEEEFGVGEDQMTINLGIDYLEDNEW